MKIPRTVLYGAAPVLAAAFPVVSLYARNPQYPAAEVVPCAAWAAAGGLGCFLLLLGLFKDASKAAVLSLPGVALFFLYGVFSRGYFVRKGAEVDELHIWADAAVEIFYGLLWVGYAAALLLARKWRPLETTARVAAVAVACTFATACVPVASSSARWLATPATPARAATGAPGADGPDIYYIVLDAYTREDILTSLYGVDNRDFLDALRARGFYVAGLARANYLQTHLSLASSLNYEYIDGSIDSSQAVTLDRCSRLLKDSAVSRFLKDRGYTYYNVRSGYFETSPNQAADVDVGPPGLEIHEFRRAILKMTPLWKLAATGLAYHQDVHQQRILAGFGGVVDIAARDGRKFVLAHIVAPHPPFVFDRDGGTLPFGNASSLIDGERSELPREKYAWGYREQVLFVDKKVLETVDAVLAHYPPDRRPVIILQGDHGSGMLFNYEDATKGYLPERTSILMAALLPADRRFEVSETMTPVNLFRIVLDGLFDARLPLLPDKTYFVPWSAPAQYFELPPEAIDPATSAPPPTGSPRAAGSTPRCRPTSRA